MRIAVALLLAVATFTTHADIGLSFKDAAGNRIDLFTTPCVSEVGVLKTMPPEIRQKAKAARVTWKGTVYEACWAPLDRASFAIVDESGDNGVVEYKGLTPVSDV